MCTAATYQTKDLYFGRTLDYLFSYGEEVVITPRSYPFSFRHMPAMDNHFSLIGMACVMDDYPLYYDAVNEKGLCIAGLNFPKNAVYQTPVPGKTNLAQFELIPWLLGQFSTVSEVRQALSSLVLTNDAFCGQLPPTPLHWIIADASEAITVESVADGLKVYDNPVGILTNNPPFDRQLFNLNNYMNLLIADASEAITVESVADGLKVYDNPVGILTNNPPFDRQLFNLNNYMNLSPKQPCNRFSEQLPLSTYCLGMGGLGLPGDLSSMSRFVRAAFTKMNSVSGDSEEESVSQFFHILGSVDQQRGCSEDENGKYEITLYTSCCNAATGTYYYTTESVSQFFHILGSVDQQRGCSEDENGKYEITLYTSCCNAATGTYYYTTYNNHQITAVDMHRVDLDSADLKRYPLEDKEQILFRN